MLHLETLLLIFSGDIISFNSKIVMFKASAKLCSVSAMLSMCHTVSSIQIHSVSIHTPQLQYPNNICIINMQ